MSQCRETYRMYFDSDRKDYITCACDLDEHPDLLSFHFDKLLGLEWRRKSEDPVPVESTRTTKPQKPHKAAISTTSEFEMVRL